MFNKGDHCFDVRFGWGVVRELKIRNVYCVVVDFYMDVMEYTAGGKSDNDDKVSMLRHYEYKLCEINKDAKKRTNN